MAQKVLVVDDEHSIVEVLQYNLEKNGYEVVVAYNGDEALRQAYKHRPDIAVLDIMMPEKDGLEVCAEMRRNMGTPVILLTARDTEVDKIIGLELGADDYVTKPFSPRELVSRIKAVLRRAKTPSSGPTAGYLHIGRIELDVAKHEVKVSGEPVPMTAKEFSLLEYLMRSSGIALSRHAILDHVWGYDFYGDPRTVDVHIRRVREKVEPDDRNPVYITTISGLGYKFNAPD